MNISRNAPVDSFAFPPRLPALKSGTQSESKSSLAPEGLVASAGPAPTCGTPDESTTGGPTTARVGTEDLMQVGMHWGQANSPFDLDGNGTVDIDDFLAMLSAWQAPAVPDEPMAAVPGQTASDIEAAEKVAGQASVALETASVSAASADVVTPGSIPATSPLTGPFGNSDIEGLRAAWDQSNSIYDLDGNGVVGIDDLLSMMSNWQAPSSQAVAPPMMPQSDTINQDSMAIVDRRSKTTVHTTDALSQASSGLRQELTAADAKKLSSTLIDRLVAAGFGDRPPTNIAELVHKLDLQPGDSKRLFADLRERYPQGLGVNLTA